MQSNTVSEFDKGTKEFSLFPNKKVLYILARSHVGIECTSVERVNKIIEFSSLPPF